MALPCSCPYCVSESCDICSDSHSYNMEIIDHKLITSEMDMVYLNIIDWNRLNGSWSNPADAIRTVTSWFLDRAHYTIVRCDLRSAPERDDWPGWRHVGRHEYYGRLYWNWFHQHQFGELVFSDEPDFFGTLTFPGKKEVQFWGDIGKVSAQTFAITQKKMGIGDLWISVLGTDTQVIIESFYNIHARVAEIFGIS